MLRQSISVTGTADPSDLYHWKNSTIIKMLSLQTYCGDVINFKTYSKSYKNKARHRNTPENMAIFLNVHDAIIERSMWERIQEMRKKNRRRKAQDRDGNMFTGILVCSDCGANLNYYFNRGNPEIKNLYS